MDKKTTILSGTINLAIVAFAVFSFLKLAEVGEMANWSWWFITAMLWVPLLGAAAVLILMILALGTLSLIEYIQTR